MLNLEWSNIFDDYIKAKFMEHKQTTYCPFIKYITVKVMSLRWIQLVTANENNFYL